MRLLRRPTSLRSDSDFPTTAGACDRSFEGDGDACVAKLNVNGSAIHSTCLGGSGAGSKQSETDAALDVALDASGNAHVFGYT